MHALAEIVKSVEKDGDTWLVVRLPKNRLKEEIENKTITNTEMRFDDGRHISNLQRNGKYDKNIDALYDEYIAAKMAYQEHGDAAHKDKLMDSVGRLMVEVFDMLQAMILDADFRDERQAIMQQIRKLADS